MNEIFAKTANDWVSGIDSKSTSVTVNDLERLQTTLSFYLCYMEANKIPLATANDPERLPMTGSDSQRPRNLNDRERPSTTFSDR